MSDKTGGNRLPPPAFPPGARKHVFGSAKRSSNADMGEGFISPDDPIPEREDSVEDAFISPDDPIPEREAVRELESAPDDAAPAPEDFPHFDAEEAVVTGMGHDAHLEAEELVMAGDPHVMELVTKISKLAAALNQKGEAGLRSSPEMDKFETTLRGYCVGYLAGRRASEDPTPDF